MGIKKKSELQEIFHRPTVIMNGFNNGEECHRDDQVAHQTSHGSNPIAYTACPKWVNLSIDSPWYRTDGLEDRKRGGGRKIVKN